MSCFNCYSARNLNGNVIDKVIERGERLRNCVVQSIMNYDNLHQEQPTKVVELDYLSKDTNHKLKAFLRGDFMTRSEEISAMDTLRSMSAADLCKVTDKTYRSDEKCDCWDLRDCESKTNSVTLKLQEKRRNATKEYLKYVDSLKVTVNSVVLNEVGEKKVFETFVKDKVVSVSQAFFVEYQIPEIISKKQATKAKVNSGMDLGVTRLCSRRPNQQPAVFKQTTVHDIGNLDRVDLDEVELKFRVSLRSFKQKSPVCLGCATVNFSIFTVSKYFTANIDLSIVFNEQTPLILGTLKVILQLGCGRLYFGKEFLDGLNSNKENWVTISSDCDTNSQASSKLVKDTKIQEERKVPDKPTAEVTKSPEVIKCEKPRENFILFGSIFIPQAQFCRELNSFVRCRLFNNDNEITSQIISGSNPYYNVHQVVPLIYEENLLSQFRYNCMVVEFFEKRQAKEFLIGVTKIPLHQFYLTFRNEVIVKYFSDKKLPVIGVDGWEAILNPKDDEIVGHVQILLALGFKEQIDQLEIERGFKSEVVKAKPFKPLEKPKFANPIEKVDAAVQSQRNNMEPQDIETLLNKLMAQKNTNNHVETSTNTEPCNSNANPTVELKSTSELLDSLQKVLTVETPSKKESFKAHVAINSALHLPSRKKCKTKKSKGKIKHEDILPSTYVTFECGEGSLKITQVVPKSTSPQWDFRCEVSLPVEYLTNVQKSLVFKVWRKSTNTNLTPNIQTDVVIGFVSLDLTVLSSGLPNIQGWFNITDLSNKCHGQINIHVTPLENVTKYHTNQESSELISSNATTSEALPDDTNELLGRALKRKFTELDEITQRLRLRLSKVTNDEAEPSNDELADEFERDINTLCIEDDFDTVDFEQEASSSNRNEEKGLLTADMLPNKQKIDSLLEKLSLLSDNNTSRYVSGCSDAENVLNDLDHNSRPNIYTEESFQRCMEEKFGSSLSDESDFRSAPEGDGSSETNKSD